MHADRPSQSALEVVFDMQRNIRPHWWQMLRSVRAWICRSPHLHREQIIGSDHHVFMSEMLVSRSEVLCGTTWRLASTRPHLPAALTIFSNLLKDKLLSLVRRPKTNKTHTFLSCVRRRRRKKLLDKVVLQKNPICLSFCTESKLSSRRRNCLLDVKQKWSTTDKIMSQHFQETRLSRNFVETILCPRKTLSHRTPPTAQPHSSAGFISGRRQVRRRVQFS